MPAAFSLAFICAAAIPRPAEQRAYRTLEGWALAFAEPKFDNT
jgi:hypothetical protein